MSPPRAASRSSFETYLHISFAREADRQVPFDHHPHIIKRRRRHHAGNDEQLRERPGPIWPRSRPAVEAFAAARVLLLLLCLRRLEPCAGRLLARLADRVRDRVVAAYRSRSGANHPNQGVARARIVRVLRPRDTAAFSARMFQVSDARLSPASVSGVPRS